MVRRFDRLRLLWRQGKVVDAWYHGLPVATTVVGAEGMHESLYQPQRLVNTLNPFKTYLQMI